MLSDMKNLRTQSYIKLILQKSVKTNEQGLINNVFLIEMKNLKLKIFLNNSYPD